MLHLLSLVVTLFFLPLTLATAASQFHLNVNTDISQCWSDCHIQVTDTIDLLGGIPNSATYITRNCGFDQYINLMTLCLPQVCVSAPDAAYAIEYGTRYCAKAGVEIDITLPTDYVAEANGYFTSEAYTSEGTKGVRVWGPGGVVLVLGTCVVAMF